MILVKVCEGCGRQFKFNSKLIDDCIWCNETLCIYCEPKHEEEHKEERRNKK